MEANSSSARDDRLPMNMDFTNRSSHHPRAFSEGGVKLFGVRLIHDRPAAAMMRKAVSMGNLSAYNSPHAAANALSPTPELSESGELPGPTDPPGYVSDGLMQNCGSLRERKKGVPWTEDEHRMFLVGLQKLGKGDWRGIARNFVPSRTPTQVASHAQKYFLRQNNLNKRKRRSSLFDMISSNPASTVCSTGDHFGSHATELNLASSATVSPDLCLGISDEARRREQPHSQASKCAYKFSSLQHAGAILGTQSSPEQTKLLPLTLNLSSPNSTGVMSLSSPSAMSSSSSSSSLSSLCKIDEASELTTSLTLSIGPPSLLEPSASELTLKLEQPYPARHLAIGGSTNNSSAYTNAIRVV
ncbi:hypothetical protein L7F22_010378 [Adiantum nelumboides]|nr:hypothetical protein [Adiantum nelumboides]